MEMKAAQWKHLKMDQMVCDNIITVVTQFAKDFLYIGIENELWLHESLQIVRSQMFPNPILNTLFSFSAVFFIQLTLVWNSFWNATLQFHSND